MRLSSCGTAFLVATVLTLTIPAWSESPKAVDPEPVTFKAHIPLGISAFFVRPARRTLYVMSTARSTLFSGWHMQGTGADRVVFGADGKPVRRFPAHLQFRVTATARLGEALDVDRDFLDIKDDLNHLLLSLRFRLKIFHGLDATTVEPQTVDMIGMPADIPYDERIYRASFNIPSVAIEDRIVLEVLQPDGERLCKFHLEF